MKPPEWNDRAVSQVHGVLILIAVAIILAAILLVILLGLIPNFEWPPVPPPPPPLIISAVFHESDVAPYPMNYDSRVVLYHNGTERYENDRLTARFFRNGAAITPCIIKTLHGASFIPTHHYGVQTMGGSGCREDYWNPGEKIAIDFTDRTFIPGDLVTVEIFDRDTGERLSRHSYAA
ncbi:type IV pilin [Methanoculleus sp. FWC-SCC1]|uniref:Type IV pilin n=1 Tax=Methanoculleus frigidifontis TaxID=2584085 RepID=A0ABT8M901_9EURY|nr:archaellin/type IV pilin N-terminal domain-containing protein [Methanoculleus sp. FWC-SCC1]MDN7024420.1 type IV pilin [Methanoculleus sp. FWC-SCC1]